MIKAWLSAGLAALLVACATPPPAETPVRYGKITQIEAVSIEGDHQLGLGAIVGAIAPNPS